MCRLVAATIVWLAAFSHAAFLYDEFTSNTPRLDGRCGPFFENTGCQDGYWCSDFGTCGPVSDPAFSNWTGPFHWAEGPQGTCMTNNGQCDGALAGLTAGSLCCDESHFHGHYCAFKGGQDPCTYFTNFNDKPRTGNTPTITTDSTTTAVVSVTAATAPAPNPTSKSATNTASPAPNTFVMVILSMLVIAAAYNLE